MGAYENQLRAGRGSYDQQRKEAEREQERTLLDVWGAGAEAFGLTGGGQARIKAAAARDETLAQGSIDAAERMWLANTARMEEARRGQSTRNLWGTLGTIGGMGIAAALTGGAALPALLAAMSAGGGIGGALGGLGAGIATGQVEGELPATLMASLNAAGSAYHVSELLKLQEDLARAQARDPFDTTTWGQ